MTSQTTPRWRGQYLGWICLAALAFFNLLPRAYPQMVNFPHILVWQLGFLCLGIWGIWMLRQFNVPFQPLGYGLDWGVGLILLALILSVSFAEFREVGAYYLSMALGYGGLLYVLRNWLLSRFPWQKIWLGLCILASLVGWASLFFWLNSAFQEEGFEFVRNTYPIGNPNWTTSYFLLVLPLVFAYSLWCQGWQRWLGLFCSAELFLMFYTTQSRGGWVGFFTLLVAATILVFLKVNKQQKRRLLIGMFSLLLAVSIILVTHPKTQRMFTTEEVSHQPQIAGISIESSTMARLWMWHTGLQILQDRPLVGVGIGNMSRVYNVYRSVESGPRPNLVQGLHSTPMQILGEMGLIGFTTVTIFLGLIVRLWYRLYHQLSSPQARYLLYAIAGSFLAYSGSVLTEYQSEVAVNYFQQGVEAAPNDQWFQHELGLAALPIDGEKAEERFRRVVELLPRGNFYDYYLLALAYLEQNQPQEKVINALALQGLVEPEFLTFPLWETDEQLSPLKEAVLEKTLEHLDTLQDQLIPETEEADLVYEYQILLKWWHDEPLEEVNLSRLRPLIQGLLVAESSPEEALNLVQSALQENPENRSLLLLRAWLDPQEYLESYLPQSNLFRQQDQPMIEQYLDDYENPHSWVRSLDPQSMSSRNRNALFYTYRNLDIRWINTIAPPPELTFHPLVNELNLFAAYPRQLIPLDQFIQRLQRAL